MEQTPWQDSLRGGLKSIAEINRFFKTELPEVPFKIFIPKNLAYSILKEGLDGPLAKQFLPSQAELLIGGLEDPIGDQAHAVPGQLIHRYKNRVLFLPQNHCPVICRYCFRKNELSESLPLFKADFEKTLAYLRSHSEVEEVIFSGGDPFILSDKKILNYINEFSNIKTIKYIRFHSRTPVSLPDRIMGSQLVNILNSACDLFEAVSVVIHANHANELEPQVIDGLKKFMSEAPRVKLFSQSVLLKGVNDCPFILTDLFKSLSRWGVQPYYLHHPDDVKGGQQFKLDIESGRKIYWQLRSQLPGWMIPQYILDNPEGRGKVPLFNPESFIHSGSSIFEEL